MLRDKLIRAREKRGWTINDAATRTGVVHHHALSKLEAGTTDPARTSIETALALIWLYDGEIRLADFVPWAGKDLTGISVKHRRGPKREDRDEFSRPDRSPARAPRQEQA